MPSRSQFKLIATTVTIFVLRCLPAQSLTFATKNHSQSSVERRSTNTVPAHTANLLGQRRSRCAPTLCQVRKLTGSVMTFTLTTREHEAQLKLLRCDRGEYLMWLYRLARRSCAREDDPGGISRFLALILTLYPVILPVTALFNVVQYNKIRFPDPTECLPLLQCERKTTSAT